MCSSTAFAYIAMVRVPSIPDTSNIEIEKPSDSNILIAASSPEGVCIWRQPQSLTRFRMNQYIWKIQRLKSQNLLVFPIWLKKIWTNIPMTSVVYAESDKILTPDMVYTKLVSDDILRCEKITDAQVKLYRLNKSCVDHASPQLKTWNVGQPEMATRQKHSINMKQLSFGKHTLETSKSQWWMIFRRNLILRRFGIFHGCDGKNDDISQCSELTSFLSRQTLTGYTIADVCHMIYDLEPVPIWTSQLMSLCTIIASWSISSLERVKHCFNESLLGNQWSSVCSNSVQSSHVCIKTLGFDWNRTILSLILNIIYRLKCLSIMQIKQYTRGDATRMQTYIKLGQLDREYTSQTGMFYHRWTANHDHAWSIYDLPFGSIFRIISNTRRITRHENFQQPQCNGM